MDKTYGVVVHRFALAARHCDCGETKVPDPEEDFYRRTMISPRDRKTMPRRTKPKGSCDEDASQPAVDDVAWDSPY